MRFMQLADVIFSAIPVVANQRPFDCRVLRHLHFTRFILDSHPKPCRDNRRTAEFLCVFVSEKIDTAISINSYYFSNQLVIVFDCV